MKRLEKLLTEEKYSRYATYAVGIFAVLYTAFQVGRVVGK